jgi:hypothetical protein
MIMKKTVKILREFSVEKFEATLQTLIDDGFEIRFSNAYEYNGSSTYYALLVREENFNSNQVAN